MTPKERAEKIASYSNKRVFSDNGTTHVDHNALCQQIADQITEAEREAVLVYANKWLQGESNEMGKDLFDFVKVIAVDPSFTRFNSLADKIKAIVMTSRLEGYRAARDKAAEVANEHGSCQDGCYCGADIGEQIQNMEPDK